VCIRRIHPQDKHITHVVSCQADRTTLQECREALVKVFDLTKDILPKEVFFVPSPVNGAITHELYYNLVHSHHENMANICSFAISGIGKLDAKSLPKTTTTRTQWLKPPLQISFSMQKKP
jgi:hypothetical protein